MVAHIHFSYFEDNGTTPLGVRQFTITGSQQSNAVSEIDVPANTQQDFEIPFPSTNVTWTPIQMGMIVPYLPNNPDIIVTNLLVWPQLQMGLGTKFATFTLENTSGSTKWQVIGFSMIPAEVNIAP